MTHDSALPGERMEHGLGPHATVIEDGEDGFWPVAALFGEDVYLQQGPSQIFMSRDQAQLVASVIAPVRPTEQPVPEASSDELRRITEAKRLIREQLLTHPDEGVRAMAELAEPADDHPAVVRIAAAIARKDSLHA